MFEFVYLSSDARWLIYSLSTIVGSLIMSITAGGLLVALLTILGNFCLNLNGDLTGL